MFSGEILICTTKYFTMVRDILFKSSIIKETYARQQTILIIKVIIPGGTWSKYKAKDSEETFIYLVSDLRKQKIFYRINNLI